LDDRVYRTLIEKIRQGSFDWVAAEAAGIGRRTFYRWMARGARGEQPYDQLALAVQQAKANARSEAERRVYLDNPFNWLRMGPGREQRDGPGWTTPVKPRFGDITEVDLDEEEDPELVAQIAQSLERVRLEELAWREGRAEQHNDGHFEPSEPEGYRR
jgi:hypothetical protein